MKIGIDLGTTNCAVSYIDEAGKPIIIQNREGERTTPSVIFFEDGVPIVGSTAKEMSVSYPDNTVQFIKRQMGNVNYIFPTETGQTYTAEELSAIILKRLKEDAEQAFGTTVTEAVITVPAYFDDAQRQATMDAGEIAGLKVLKVINEPTAAALAYASKQGHGLKNQTILVYDLGGGTFDVTILQFKNGEIEVKATGGLKNLGGFDFDNAISSYIQEKFEDDFGIDLYDDPEALQELVIRAEACKKNLTSREKVSVTISSFGKTLQEVITRQQFEAMIKSSLNQTKRIMYECLEEANLSWGHIDKILLVGGSTRIPAVANMIEEETGITPSLDINPDEAVALGAAVQLSLLDEDQDLAFSQQPVKAIRDVNSHSLGEILYISGTDNRENFIIMKKNTPIPAVAELTSYTRDHHQKAIRIQITEGESSDIEEVRIIGESTIELLPKCPKGTPICTKLTYDDNGIIHVSAYDESTETFLGDFDIERASNLKRTDVEEKKKKFLLLDID